MKLSAKVDNKITIAFSGGIDSVFATDFFMNGRKDITLAYFNHGTSHGNEAEEFAVCFAAERNLPIKIGRTSCKMPKGVSKEAWWRDQRYSFFSSLDEQIVMCHHLDDVVETWIYSCSLGKPQLIPSVNKNIVRPFLFFTKQDIREFVSRKPNLKWIDDPSNNDVAFCRNRIRHNVIPELLKVNPGLYKSVRKLVGQNNTLNEYTND